MRKEWRGALIGGIVGIILPILIFIILLSICRGSACGEYGFALQSIFLISGLTFLVGLILGYVAISQNSRTILISIIGFIIPWIYFSYKYFNYVALPRIEQRGLGGLLFGTLIFCLVLTLLASFVGRIFNRK